MKPGPILFALLIASLAGCSDGIDNERLRVDVIEDNPDGFAIGALPLRATSAYLRAATAQGLVAFDAKGDIVPALSSRWIVTDDGMSYIFRLDKIRWNDGREVTSEEVAAALNIRFTELRRNAFGGELAMVDRAVSMTGKVVEIRLRAPMPNLLELLAQPQLGIIRKGAGSGPMQATKNGPAMQLRLKGVNEKGEPALNNERIALRPNRIATALAQFEADNTDVIAGAQFHHLPQIEAADISGGITQSDPVPGLFGLLFVSDGPFLSERANREAIAMAIDRPRLLTSFDNIAWQESITLMPDTLQNRSDVPLPAWAPLSIEQRQDAARQAISRWRSGNGNIRPLRIAVPSGPGGRIFFANIRRDLAAVGLQAERAKISGAADLRLIDKVADMSSPSWYLAQLSCGVSNICSEQADALLQQARMARTAGERQRLLGEAETALQQTRNFIPLANPLRWSLTRNGLLGYVPNARGWHWLQYLGREPT